ncbi:MAG: thioredoxin family protein [Mycobacterium sp.]
MTPLLYSAIAIVVALGVAAIVGSRINRRSGVLRETVIADGDRPADPDTSDLGLSRTGPTIVHFSAAWCGPCAGVRRVVDQVCADLPEVAHVEIDMDANPAAARRLAVLSLPTTFVFDANGRQRYRTSGVPEPAGLRSAVAPLLA